MKKSSRKKSTAPGRKKSAAGASGMRYCGIRPAPPRAFAPEVGPHRARLIMMSAQKWVNGTTLHYWFFPGPSTQKQAVRKAFKIWKDQGIGLNFVEVAQRAQAEIRIAFEDDGSWSGIGRDILTFPKNEQTLNIGWDIARDVDTAVHEIGHTLGFPHEHQNPKAGIVWDEPAVYAALAKPPNRWNHDKTYYNIIRKIEPDSVQGSSWDANSIMHYPFEAGLIRQPAKYRNGLTPAGGLSARDVRWAKSFYPPLKKTDHNLLAPFASTPLKTGPGKQANYLIQPAETRTYEMRTFGSSDSVMVLFEDTGDGKLKYVTADDDSGTEKNAHLRLKLEKDRKYVLRIRVMYAEPEADSAVMLW